MRSALYPEISRALHRKTPATCLGSSPRPSAELSFRFIRYLSEHSPGSPQLSCLALFTPCLHPRSRADCHRYLCGYSLGSPQFCCLALITPYLGLGFRFGTCGYLSRYSPALTLDLLPGARHPMPSLALHALAAAATCAATRWALPSSLARSSSPRAFTRALALVAAAIPAATRWALTSSSCLALYPAVQLNPLPGAYRNSCSLHQFTLPCFGSLCFPVPNLYLRKN